MKKQSPKRKSLRNKTVLHVITGSIAAYKACEQIRAMKEEGARVIAVLTKAAEEFITPLTIRSLTGEWVYGDLFAKETPHHVLHTSLADTADLILIAPASADIIARLACGMADDLATSVVLATGSPVLIAPAMNDRMYRHPLTQNNIRRLKETGYHFLDPVEGYLACGRVAVGHIAETSAILDAVRRCIRQ